MTAEVNEATASAMAGWSAVMNSYPWILGIVFILAGLVIALQGYKLFKWIATGLIAGGSALFVIVFFTSLGWMDATVGTVLTCLTALLVGAVCGYIVYRYEKVQDLALGIVGGYFLGFMIYSICLAAGWNSVWGMLVLTILGAIAGAVFAFKFPDFVVVECSSAIGSYMFMRGWSFCFGGYPSESVIINSIKSG